jgi:hypothetical protein
MAANFKTAAATALISVADLQEQSTQNLPDTKPHFLKCLRYWDANLAKRNADEMSAKLQADALWRMIGQKLTVDEMSQLTEMVLERCEWFPSIAECKRIMDENNYSNPFYRNRQAQRLEGNGYTSLAAPTKQLRKPDADPKSVRALIDRAA